MKQVPKNEMANFRAKYQDWLRAREKFDEEIQKILSGTAKGGAGVLSLAQSLDRTYKDFQDAARPFVKWGAS